MIRIYADSDWLEVKEIYDISKPDEMKGIVNPSQIKPLADDGKMLKDFFNSNIWVYEQDNKILGFIGRRDTVVSWLFVRPDHRREGIARQLMETLIASFKGDLILFLVKSNTAALKLYQGLGFQIQDEFEGNMYGQKIPAVKMRLDNTDN
ncbi:MAG: GNAT family N-acetyltransferase [Desulfobacteraceae bacterium]|nr:GNAT family N-acetyltransferase [Desulfobacteraceae bacterium]